MKNTLSNVTKNCANSLGQFTSQPALNQLSYAGENCAVT
jgi:hypothetical protein